MIGDAEVSSFLLCICINVKKGSYFLEYFNGL